MKKKEKQHTDKVTEARTQLDLGFYKRVSVAFQSSQKYFLHLEGQLSEII